MDIELSPYFEGQTLKLNTFIGSLPGVKAINSDFKVKQGDLELIRYSINYMLESVNDEILRYMQKGVWINTDLKMANMREPKIVVLDQALSLESNPLLKH